MITLKKRTIKTDWLDIGEGQKVKIDYPTRGQIHILQDYLIRHDISNYARYYLKFVIKDWEGFGEDCSLVNNELSNELWYLLTQDYNQFMSLFGLIEDELKWIDVDKKKLHLPENSEPKIS